MHLSSHHKSVHLLLYLCWTSKNAFSQELNIHQNSGSNERSVGSFFYQQPEYPRDCTETRTQCSTNTLSDVYLIKPDGYPEPFEVYCDNTVDSGGWTVIHRLQGGSILFNRTLKEFKLGFGFLSQEFWIGNEKLSFLTNQNTYELRIDVTNADDLSFYVTYSKFRTSDEYGEYKLTSVGQYNGTEDEINRFLCPPNREGEVYTDLNCEQRCYCTSGRLSCDNTYQCSNNAVCEERNNLLQCYCNEGYTGDGVNCTIDTPPSDCKDVNDRVSTESGVYSIKPTTWQGDPFDVYCNMSDGGGWTVIYRIFDGSVLFNRNWTDYKTGFGFLHQEFWIGNDKVSFLTNQNSYELRLDVTSDAGLSFYVTYNRFRLGDEYSEYKLTSVGQYNGTEDEINLFLCPPKSEGGVYTDPNCTRQCYCTGGRFSCDSGYMCSSNAVCEERNNVLQCYCNEGYTGDGVNCTIDILPTDCKDIYDRVSTESDVYKIKPTTWQGDPFEVYCNMTDGGGWTVFLRRVNGSQDFYLYWSDYKNGFGSADHELWLGNDKLHSLITQGNTQLRVDLVNRFGAPYYAKYSFFSISDESDNYRVSVGGHSGTAGDHLAYFRGQAFTTRDRDNDNWSSANCVTHGNSACGHPPCTFNGGWWYHVCGHYPLTGPYGTDCLYWILPGSLCNVKYAEMKVRRT